jgi:hypothetical protein
MQLCDNKFIPPVDCIKYGINSYLFVMWETDPSYGWCDPKYEEIRQFKPSSDEFFKVWSDQRNVRMKKERIERKKRAQEKRNKKREDEVKRIAAEKQETITRVTFKKRHGGKRKMKRESVREKRSNMACSKDAQETRKTGRENDCKKRSKVACKKSAQKKRKMDRGSDYKKIAHEKRKNNV